MFPTSIPSEETYSAHDAIVHILMSNFLSSDGLIPWGNNKFHEFILYMYKAFIKCALSGNQAINVYT